MTAVAELAALREANCRLRDKLLEICAACEACGGTGVVTVKSHPRGVLVERQEDCGECLDIRECLR